MTGMCTFLVSDDRSRGIAGNSACACAHGLGDNLQFVGVWFVVLLLVLDPAVVLQEELAGLLEDTAALTDGTLIQKDVVQVKLYP